MIDPLSIWMDVRVIYGANLECICSKINSSWEFIGDISVQFDRKLARKLTRKFLKMITTAWS
jgi:hypothetical protein